jgi:hypothetical protein
VDARVQAVAAVCSPLSLAPAAVKIDRPEAWPYRRFVMRNLLEIYRCVAQRRQVPVPIEEASRFTHIRHWDEHIVSPRWGFRGAEDYYARASVAERLSLLEVPALLVAAAADPMIPREAQAAALKLRPTQLEVRWVDRGGHVGFSRNLDLGEAGPVGIEGQAISWLLRHRGGEAARGQGGGPK